MNQHDTLYDNIQTIYNAHWFAINQQQAIRTIDTVQVYPLMTFEIDVNRHCSKQVIDIINESACMKQLPLEIVTLILDSLLYRA
jgi:hypothetical protein